MKKEELICTVFNSDAQQTVDRLNESVSDFEKRRLNTYYMAIPAKGSSPMVRGWSRIIRITEKMVFVIIIIILLTGVCQAGSKNRGYNIYDKNGNYSGRIDDRGQLYNKGGEYDGRLSKEGNIYDRNDKYKGQIKKEK